eukprot:SAG31_NODE_7915_length_1566_cov_1.241990_3_plen_77_part_01
MPVPRLAISSRVVRQYMYGSTGVVCLRSIAAMLRLKGADVEVEGPVLKLSRYYAMYISLNIFYFLGGGGGGAPLKKT